MALAPLPTPPAPAGGYAPVIIRRGLGFVSGQFPIKDDALAYLGRVGIERTPEEGAEACRLAALNVLAQIYAATEGFEGLDGLLRLDGYIASADAFHAQPAILDAASEVLRDHLGAKGRHARTAFAVSRLPLDATVELAVSFVVR